MDAGAAADYARKTERVKNLLSSFYGDAPAAEAQPGAAAAGVGAGAGSPGGGTADPERGGPAGGSPAAAPPGGAGAAARPAPPGAALDSASFNPDRHVAQMTRTMGVERLLAEHRSMTREIKNLDSEMQQLVYENYNKFIAATDTIRSMKANIDGMEADMERLASSMGSVAERSSAVNAKLLKRRQHIEELNRVQALLDNLQAVFDLPARMRAALEDDALGSAVSFYAEAAPLLRKHGHQGAFRAIAADADAVADQVKAALKRRLAGRKDDTEHVVLLLRKLGEGDDTLQERYLQGRAERMQRILQEAEVVAAAMAAASRPAQPGGAAAAAGPAAVDSPEAWGCGPDGSLPSLARFVRALDERLINALQETAVNVTSIFLQDDTAAARRKPLVRVCKEAVGAYFKLVKRAVDDAATGAAQRAAGLPLARGDLDFSTSSPSLAFPEDWGADLVAQAMSAVATDVGLLHNQLPELSLRDWAAAATEQAVRCHIGAAFAALRERITCGVKLLQVQLSAPGANQSSPLSAASSYLADAMQRGVTSLLKGMSAYEQQRGRLLAAVHDQLSDVVQGELQGLFQSLVGDFLATARLRDPNLAPPAGEGSRQPGGSSGGAEAGPPAAPDEPPKTGLVLLLSRLCFFMEGTTVPCVMEVLGTSFAARGGPRAGDEPPRFVGGEVARRIGTAANLLLAAYVDLHGRALSLLVERSVASTNWLQAQPPRAPRPVCDLLLERLSRAEAEVVRLVDAAGRAPPAPGLRPDAASSSHHQRGGSAGDALESSAVERGVAKLFRGKVQPYGAGGAPRLSQSALLAGVAISGFKSLVECVRLQTLGRAGLQQLQLDVYYMRPQVLRLLGGADAEAVAQLLDEVVAAGAQRCVDPALLETSTLDKALAAASLG